MRPDILTGPVLIAEDEENDIFLLRRAFRKSGSGLQPVFVRDGQEAVDYLSGSAPFEDRLRYPPPALLIIDLHMPRMDGFDLLAWLTENRFQIPAVVLTSSCLQSDVQRARELGAAEYLVKPHAFGELERLVHQLLARWPQPLQIS